MASCRLPGVTIHGNVRNVTQTDQIINTNTYNNITSAQTESTPENSSSPIRDEKNPSGRPTNLPPRNKYDLLKEKDYLDINTFLCEAPGFLHRISTGCVYILNNENFLSENDRRKGSEVDVKGLEYFFKDDLAWKDVIIKRNLKAQEMKEWLEAISQRDFSSFDALFIVIMSHGNTKGIYGTDKIEMEIEPMLHLFATDKCPSLAGKPKIFILQACRGELDDIGHCMLATDAIVESPSKMISIPRFSDYIIAYPCIPGYSAVRDEVHGTLYIQSLVQNLRQFYSREHLLDILLRVNWLVANGDNELTIKCMPCIDVRMRKKCYFDSYFCQVKKKINELKIRNESADTRIPMENSE